MKDGEGEEVALFNHNDAGLPPKFSPFEGSEKNAPASASAGQKKGGVAAADTSAKQFSSNYKASTYFFIL